MLWATIMLGAAGLLLGLLRPHVLAVVAASVLVAIAYLVLAPLLKLPLLISLAFAFGLLGSLQGGYLMGLLLVHFSQRTQPHPLAEEEHAGCSPKQPTHTRRAVSS